MVADWLAGWAGEGSYNGPEERHDDKIGVTIGSQTEYFDPPRQKDIDTQAFVNLRQMLTQAGYGADAADTRASGGQA
jgi:hypothetical protein